MHAKIKASVAQCIEAITQLNTPQSLQFIEDVAAAIASCYQKGNKLLIAGNGGSLCDAMHFAEELTGFYRNYRKALPAIALADPSHITCVGNDVGFETIFSRGVEAHGKKGDLFVGMTTSGNSPNIINAFEAANELELNTIAFLGKGGGQLKGVADYELIIDGFTYSDRIQEAHMAAIHIILEMVEDQLFPKSEKGIPSSQREVVKAHV